jgi:membrane protein implicated in regulation of membrane protease activity
VDKVSRLARFAGLALLVGVIALLFPKAWVAAAAVAVLAAVNFGVAWRARSRTGTE